MSCFSLVTSPGRGQHLRNCLLKQPDVNRGCTNAGHPCASQEPPPRPGPLHSGPESTCRNLTCRVLPEHVPGSDGAISECLSHAFRGGHGLVPGRAGSRPAAGAGGRHMTLEVSPSQLVPERPPAGLQKAVSAGGNVLRKTPSRARFRDDAEGLYSLRPEPGSSSPGCQVTRQPGQRQAPALWHSCPWSSPRPESSRVAGAACCGRRRAPLGAGSGPAARRSAALSHKRLPT